MTAFLTLNSWQVQVSDPQASFSIKRVHKNMEGRWGNIKVRSPRLVRSWKFESQLVEKEEADALEGLVDGLGNYCSFSSDLWGTRGMAPTAINWTAGTAGGVVGNCAATNNLSQSWDLGSLAWRYNLAYTVCVWRNPNTSFSSFCFRDDGVKVASGVRNDGADTSWASLSNGILTLNGGASFKYDELVVVPYRMTVAQMIAYHTRTNGGTAWSNFPRLMAGGLFLMGTGTEIEVAPFSDGARDMGRINSTFTAWDPAARTVKFELVEIPA